MRGRSPGRPAPHVGRRRLATGCTAAWLTADPTERMIIAHDSRHDESPRAQRVEHLVSRRLGLRKTRGLAGCQWEWFGHPLVSRASVGDGQSPVEIADRIVSVAQILVAPHAADEGQQGALHRPPGPPSPTRDPPCPSRVRPAPSRRRDSCPGCHPRGTPRPLRGRVSPRSWQQKPSR